MKPRCNHRFVNFRMTLVIAAVLQLAAGHVAAQQGAALEEIIVTARKIEESLQDVPISVTALTADDMDKRSMPDLKDIARFTPNLYFATTGAASPHQSAIFMRGIGQVDYYATADPAVALYIDGVYHGRSQGGVLDLLDLERIEVLRGPQGTLFGKNALGGAVNVLSSVPTGEFGGRASLTVGNENRVNFGGSVDLPTLGDDVLVRLSGMTKNRGCIARRLNDNACYNDQDTVVARGFLRWLATDNITVDIIGDVTAADSHSLPHSLVAVDTAPGKVTDLWNGLTAAGIVSGPPMDQNLAGLTSSDPYDTEGNRPTNTALDVYGVSGHIAWETAFGTIHSITAYRDVFTNVIENSDGSTALFAEVFGKSDADAISQEIRIDGQAFGDQLDYVAGFFYIHEDNYTEETLDLFTELLLGFTVFNDQTTDSYAGFAQLSYRPIERLSVTAGARYTWDEKDWLGRSATAFDPPGTFSRLAPINIVESWNAWTPKFGIDYHINDEMLVYASASRGFRSGGFNGRAGAPAEVGAYNPEFVWTYEGGFKFDLWERRIRLNAAGFFSNYKDRQETVLRSYRDADGNVIFAPIVENAASVDIWGFETELVALFSERFRVESTVGYTDGEFTELEPGIVGITLDSNLTFTPKWTASIAGEYGVPVPFMNGNLTARLDWTYRDTVYFIPTPGPISTQDGFGLLNARLTFKSGDGKWEVAAYGRNLTDKIYKVWANDQTEFFGIGFAWYSDPREFGVTVTRQF